MPQATAVFPYPIDAVAPPLAEQARALGAEVEEAAAHNAVPLTIRTGNATMTAEMRDDGGTQLTLLAAEAELLAELIDRINGFASSRFETVPQWLGLKPPKMTMTEVVSVTQLSPHYRRVRLKGDFTAFLSNDSVHFRFLIGPEGADWPATGANGVDWPGGIDAWHRPPYTVVALDPAGRWLDTDIFLHTGGRVTDWTETAQPGEAMMIAGPGGKAVRQAPWLGMVGDETAMPVILRGLQAAESDTRGQVFVLLPDEADAQHVPCPEGIAVTFVPRSEGVDLLGLLARLELPVEGPRAVFFAGERAEAARARQVAVEMGLGTDEFRAASYWTAGWVPPESQRKAR